MEAIDLCNTDDSDNNDQLSNIEQQKNSNVKRLKRGSDDDDESIISISSTEEEDKKIAAPYNNNTKQAAAKNKSSHRKRRAPKRLRGAILKKAPQLKCEQSKSSSSEVIIKKMRSVHQVYSEDEGDKIETDNMKRRARRGTCFTDAEYTHTTKPMRQMLQPKDRAMIAVAKQNIKDNDRKQCSSSYEEKWDECWCNKEEQLQTITTNQSQGGISIPVSLVSFNTSDDQSATSEVTIDISASSSEAASAID